MEKSTNTAYGGKGTQGENPTGPSIGTPTKRRGPRKTQPDTSEEESPDVKARKLQAVIRELQEAGIRVHTWADTNGGGEPVLAIAVVGFTLDEQRNFKIAKNGGGNSQE